MADRGNPGPVFGQIAQNFFDTIQSDLVFICKYNDDEFITFEGDRLGREPNPALDPLYVQVRIIPATPRKPEIGPLAKTRYTGSMMVDIYRVPGSGQKMSDDIAEKVFSMQHTAVEGVYYGDADPEDIGRAFGGSWWHFHVALPFKFNL